MRTMSVDMFIHRGDPALGRRLFGVYSRTALWFLAGMFFLWALGFESIYGHPTPFYALYAPAFDTFVVSGGMAVVLAGAYLLFGQAYLRRPSRRVAMLGTVWAAGLGAVVLMVFQEGRHEGRPLPEHLAHGASLLFAHLLAAGLFFLFLGVIIRLLERSAWYGSGPDSSNASSEGPATYLPGPAPIGMLLCGLVIFAVLFAGAIAMIRGGFEGIAQAYRRETYEYIGDIGKAASIRALFTRYLEIQPYLSLHARAAPPGPIALLWIFSFVVGRSAMALSLATLIFGAAAVVPLYFWVREITSHRVALICCLIYVLIPSIVLFSATCAEILFMPFLLVTLFLFDRALRRGGLGYALAAGVGYAVLSLLKFTLLGVGAYFALAGLWMLGKRGHRRNVFQTAALMMAGFLALHLMVRWWTGFDMVACFWTAKAHFDLDQHHLDQITPRLPGWTYRLINPVTWFYFAGIPVSVLGLWRWRRPAADGTTGLFLVILGTLIALDLFYLGRGEGERSALYVFPFMAVPAAHLLEEFGENARSITPLAATLAFLALQCWLTEAYFYTYW